MELLREIAPRVARVAFLYNPPAAPFAEFYLKPFKAVAASSGVEAIAAPVHNISEFETVISAHARAPNGGLIVMPDAFVNTHPGKNRIVGGSPSSPGSLCISIKCENRWPAVLWIRHAQ